MTGKIVAYYRVSKKSQGESGLGLEAQQRAVGAYVDSHKRTLIAEFVEVESGKRDDNRPRLQEALDRCRLTGATLVIAKLDRLSRDLEFLARLTKSEIAFIACDMPSANRLTVHIMAAVAQDERERIAARTRDGLASIKAKLVRGEQHVSKRSGKPVTALGGFRGVLPNTKAGRATRTAIADQFAKRVGPMVTIMHANGATLAKMAETLNSQHIRTPRGAAWTPTAIKRVLDRLTPEKAA